MYCGSSNYAPLARAARDVEFGSRVFQVLVRIDKSGQTRTQPESKQVKLLLRPDVRVNKVETKIDTLADKLANLTFSLKKGTINSCRITLPGSEVLRGN